MQIFIVQATAENLQVAELKEAMKVDSKCRISFKKVMKRMGLTVEEVENANLELEGEQLVIELVRRQPEELSNEKVLMEFLESLYKEGEISSKDGKVTITIQATIELR